MSMLSEVIDIDNHNNPGRVGSYYFMGFEKREDDYILDVEMFSPLLYPADDDEEEYNLIEEEYNKIMELFNSFEHKHELYNIYSWMDASSYSYWARSDGGNYISTTVSIPNVDDVQKVDIDTLSDHITEYLTELGWKLKEINSELGGRFFDYINEM